MRHHLPWNLLDPAEREAIWHGIIARLRRLGARRLLAELGCQGITVRRDGERLVMHGDFDDTHLWLLGYYAVEVAELIDSHEEVGLSLTQGGVSLDGCGAANVVRGKTGADETREAG